MTHLNHNRLSSFSVLLFTTLCLVTGQRSQATLLAYEGFDYGTAGISGQNGGTGWGDAWATSGVETDGTSMATPTGYNLATTGGRVHVAAATGKNLGDRDLDFSIEMNPVSQQTFYISYLFEREDAVNNPSDEWVNLYLVNSLGGSPQILLQSGDAENLRITTNGAPYTSTGNDYFKLNTTYLVVAKGVYNPAGTNDVLSVATYEVGVDTVGAEPTTWALTATGDGAGTLNHVRILWDNVNTGTVNMDEIRIGTTWADVVGVSQHPGDANGDGMVNLADLQILGDNWQSTTATWSEADFTGDGNVNLADLQIIGDNWGYGTGPDVAFDEALTQVVIPEPASFVLLLSGALILRRRTTR